MLRVLFFASVREGMGCASVDMPYEPDLQALLSSLRTRYGKEKTRCLASPDILVARNQELCRGNVNLQLGDEIAFFPPVTGG